MIFLSLHHEQPDHEHFVLFKRKRFRHCPYVVGYWHKQDVNMWYVGGEFVQEGHLLEEGYSHFCLIAEMDKE